MSKLACCILAVHLMVSGALADDEPAPALKPETVLATVGDAAITEADFQLFAAIHNFPKEQQALARTKLLDKIIELRLIQQALRRQKIKPDPDELHGSILRVKDLIRRRKDDPDALLQRLGLTPAALEEQLGLSIAWDQFVKASITDEQITAHFQQHQPEFDGTQLRASQIILKLKEPAPAKDLQDRKQRLSAIRRDVLAKKLTFADAAKKYSEAPSKNQGGDVGWFPFRGKMPIPFCDAAFALKPGEISEPVVSPFGVHLIQVTEREPGEFTLDDVRRDVVAQLDQQLWEQTVAAERKLSKVTILKPAK